MIFPDLPKKRYFRTQGQINQDNQQVETVVVETTISNAGDLAEEWFQRHFPEQTIVPLHPSTTPTFAEDPWGYTKFIGICAFMVVWASYWHQFQ